jgi:exodeoxyribonuclease VII large subunit
VREPANRLREAQQRVDVAKDALARLLRRFVPDARAKLAGHLRALQSHNPSRELAARRTSLDELRRRFTAAPMQLLQVHRQRFTKTEAILRVLGPEATLRRGYSITTDADGTLISSVTQVSGESACARDWQTAVSSPKW